MRFPSDCNIASLLFSHHVALLTGRDLEGQARGLRPVLFVFQAKTASRGFVNVTSRLDPYNSKQLLFGNRLGGHV